MTSTSNLADVVRHYQRSIERHGEDETRLLHCITKLFNLPITFEHLQETGIGKTVNALRKINGEVGVAAKTLVTKWKAMVAAEEEPTGPSHNNNEEDSNRSNGRRSSDEDQDQENKGSNSSGGEDKSKHESRRPKSSEHKSKSSSSNSSKSHSKSSRSDSDKRHKSSSSDDKTGSMSKEHRKDHKSSSSSSEHRKSKDLLSSTPAKSSSSNHSNHKSSNHSSDNSTSNSKQKHHSSSHKSDHSKSKHEKIREDKSQHHHNNEAKQLAKEKTDKHKSSSTSSSSKSSSSKRARTPQRLDDDSPQAKKPKSKPKTDAVEQKETPDGFDSSMGANFDDVLGMLNMPISGKKNALKLKSPNKATSTTLTATATSTVNTGSAAVPNASKRITTTTTSSSSSRMTSTRKPELLASSAKLEPLDPSIALELPTISNNYKPMPLNQTVMDVVFNHGLGSSAHKATRINESEALAAGISSKTMRTKIYSGVRTGQILQVPSLFDLCIRVLQKNIDALEYTGGVPFEVLRPVLERATPHQLLNFEEYNPYLMEDSDVLWQQHVHRHCRSQHREEMETWREMFLRCEEEKARKLSVIAESIKASQKISEAPVRKTQLAFVDSMVKPPRNVQRKQEQYGTNRKLIATPAARVAALSNVTPNAAKVGDARLRVLNSARDAAQVSAAPMRNKKAPLMAKALQLIRGRQRR
ncbi:hypothetical protein ACLKA6_000100 [Drosophila palustris]